MPALCFSPLLGVMLLAVPLKLDNDLGHVLRIPRNESE